eukprot:2123252-Prymnesium_polylepis.2
MRGNDGHPLAEHSRGGCERRSGVGWLLKWQWPTGVGRLRRRRRQGNRRWWRLRWWRHQLGWWGGDGRRLGQHQEKEPEERLTSGVWCELHLAGHLVEQAQRRWPRTPNALDMAGIDKPFQCAELRIAIGELCPRGRRQEAGEDRVGCALIHQTLVLAGVLVGAAASHTLVRVKGRRKD